MITEDPKPRSLKSLANTPFKKAMLGVQFLSYILIVGSPVIGGAIGKVLGLTALKTGSLILGVFITGEVLFYGSLAFLGKELILIIKEKIQRRFRRRSEPSE